MRIGISSRARDPEGLAKAIVAAGHEPVVLEEEEPTFLYELVHATEHHAAVFPMEIDTGIVRNPALPKRRTKQGSKYF